MKRKRFLVMVKVILLLTISMSLSGQIADKGDKHYEPTWESLAQHSSPQWYEDAVLGIYFHWGVYSVAEMGEWYAQHMYLEKGDRYHSGNIDYHKKTYGDPCTEFGYKDFVPMFKAEKWDPDFWAELFENAGADFAGPVAEHCDGFAMWDSEYDEYNSMDKGPHRDVVGEMAKAVRNHGMKFITTFHNLRWSWLDAARRLCPEGVDVNDPKYSGLYGPVHKPGDPMTESFKKEWFNKIIEVIDKYQPDIIYLEGDICKPLGEEYSMPFLAYYYNSAIGSINRHSSEWGQEVVVTHKGDDLPRSCSVLDMEGYSLKEPDRERWQTDQTILNKWYWGYDMHAKCLPVDLLIDGIVDRTSKNGVTLLSIGPKADGTIPNDQIEVLIKIGDWMKVNKEALYGADPAPFSKGGVDTWKAGTLRFTEKGPYLYAIDLEKPIAGKVIPGVTPVQGSTICMLGSNKKLAWHQNGADVVIDEIPNPLPCDYAWSFKIHVSDKSN
jgi:alpha-L-fucosidase